MFKVEDGLVMVVPSPFGPLSTNNVHHLIPPKLDQHLTDERQAGGAQVVFPTYGFV